MEPSATRQADLSQLDIVDALDDGVYAVDQHGACIFASRAALRILGYDAVDELLGRNMHELIHHTRPDGSPYPQSACPLMQAVETGRPVRLEHELLWRRDGTPFHAEYSSFPIAAPHGAGGCVVTFRETSVRDSAQRRLAVQHAVSRVLAGSNSLEKMAERLLDAIGTGLDWDVGLVWLRPRSSAEPGLVCTAQWQSRAVRIADQIANGAHSITSLSDPSFQPPLIDMPVLVQDLASASDPEARQAAKLGLRSSFSFPIIDGETSIGVIEFFGRDTIEVDESLSASVFTLGQQIGRTIERRVATEALLDSESLKAAILALSPDCVISIDAAGRILEFNATAARTFKREAEQVIGADLVSTIFPPETQASQSQAFAHALSGVGAMLSRRLEVDAIRSDGTVFPAELTMSQISTGAHPRFTLYLRDITLRRREQARIRESEAKFRTIANAIPQLAWMTDSSGSIVWYNRRWYDYTGTNLEQMVGWGWTKIHHPDHLVRVESHFRDSLLNGQPWEDTFPLRGADGNYRWFLSRAVPIHEDTDDPAVAGPISGWFGTNTDITAIRDAEQLLEDARDAAEAANRAKSTFIANMSHELRTPLSAIIGYSEMLSEEIEDGGQPADLGRDVKKIETNARHLLGLINDVLDLSKVESGKMEAFIETFEVAAAVKGVASTVGSLLQKRGNRLQLELAPDVGMMESDITRVRQILLNLLSNATKFTESGTITLRVRRECRPGDVDRLVFDVQDTGIGMTQEQLGKLFKRFQQADASTTRQFGGTGLGLALTKAFVALLDGDISVSSESGQGSIFTVTLPARLVEPQALHVDDGVGETALPGQDAVLVIDDDETQRELMSRFLRREGYSAHLAPDGRTGLAMAKRLLPRAILLDVTMPGLDGWSVLSALKADPELAAIPVVMVTFTSDRALAASLGAADYVVKPVDWERLRHVMERFRDDEGDVLVIDDEADTRHRIRQALEKNGWSVVEAADGQAALEIVSRAVPRMILLDLTMPVMDGFEFLAALRSRPDGQTVPVVVLTALDLTLEDRRRLRGANQVLNKGATSLADLAERLKALG